MTLAESYLEKSREHLLAELGKRGFGKRILDAFASVPRQEFLPSTLSLRAYEDRALPIGEGQTISQPAMIGIMLDALDPHEGDRALEVGAGCGYASALLARLVKEVHAVEHLPILAESAERTLSRLGFSNVRVHVKDGTKGLSEWAPFDRILVSAAARSVPDALLAQLAPGGRIVIPVGDQDEQILHIGRRPRGDGPLPVEWVKGTQCVFVPLIGT